MVLSLSESCLIKIQAEIVSGRMKYVDHVLSPQVRQQILTTILNRGDINDPNCLKVLSSVEFLKGMWSLSTLHGNVNDPEQAGSVVMMTDIDDRKYLDQVIKSLSTAAHDEGTVGDGITQLALNLYGLMEEDEKQIREVNLQSVVDLIARCSNLKSLDLRLIKYFVSPRLYESSDNDSDGPVMSLFAKKKTGGGLLNESDAFKPCRSVIEKVSELSLIGASDSIPLLSVFRYPVLQFKNLTSLRLVNWKTDPKAWREFLGYTQETLTKLEVHDVECFERSHNYAILPMPLPKLKWLKVSGEKFCTSRWRLFIRNIAQCSKLEYLFVELDMPKEKKDVELWEVLNKMDCRVELKVCGMDCLAGEMAAGKPNYCLQWLNAFGDKIMGVSFYGVWNGRTTEAIQRILEVCQNATAVSFMVKTFGAVGDDQLKEVSKSLAPLVKNKERSENLVAFSWFGDLHEAVLEPLFENCINLENLSLFRCSQLTNQHLIDWARRGGGSRMSDLSLTVCGTVGCDGLIPVLKNSGSKLKRFIFEPKDDNEPPIWPIVFSHCRYIRTVNVPSIWKKCYFDESFFKKIWFRDDSP